MSINCKSILFIPFSFARNQQLRERIILNSEMADVNSNFNSVVKASLLELERQGMSRVLRNQKVKAISTLASGQDLLALLKSTPLLPHAKMLLVLIRLFLWRIDYALDGSMFWLRKCDFSRLFHTDRSWHTYRRIFCGFWISDRHDFLLMQEHFIWPLLKQKALYCG